MSDPAPSRHRCLTCNSTSENPRNLVVFIDGTSNRLGHKDTNVAKLYKSVLDSRDPNLEQDQLYLEGIGALTGSISEMLFAWNVEENVKEAYKWLVGKYRAGDQIYLFGFSRGAYQVRALASMIHEVGLLTYEVNQRTNEAYRHYLAIDPKNPKTRESAIDFRKNFCWQGVRIHFIGVWDTVSSLGFIKRDVHITTSATVTNACHFRHALALDECRVKFMPEYFVEVNAHHTKVTSPRANVGNVKEVWFAGHHADVGGNSKPHSCGEIYPVHAGNVPLRWMELHAAAEGLDFESGRLAWCPEDIELGKVDSMNIWYKILEYLPIRHQVSFNGAAKHKRIWHLSRPRVVIPDQHIHFSVLPGDVYTPRAVLSHDVDLPMVSRNTPQELWMTEPWTSEFLNESTVTRLLTSLLSDRQTTLSYLGEVLFLLNFVFDNGQTPLIPIPEWLGISIREQPGSPSIPVPDISIRVDTLVLTVIHDALSSPAAFDSEYEELVTRARGSLAQMLDPPPACAPRLLYVVRLMAKHERLRQHFVAHNEVVAALVSALERTMTNVTESLFSLIVDSLCYVIRDEDKRGYVIEQLNTTSNETQTGQSRLFMTLGAKVPNHLTASLKMVTTLAQFPSSFSATDQLKSEILKLTKNKKIPVGTAAVKALVALGVSVPQDTPIPNIIGYLGDVLPQLDAEGGNHFPENITNAVPPSSESDRTGSTSSNAGIVASLPAPQVDGETTIPDPNLPLHPIFQISESGQLDREDTVMAKLLQTLKSPNAHTRTVATFTLLKLCRYRTIRTFCSQNEVLNIFMAQLEKKKTSLLAAYALNTCLKLGMWTPADFDRVVQPIVDMFDKGWFDDAVGRVEGFKLFGELMAPGDRTLREKVISTILPTLMKKLGNGVHHEVRTSLICLDILLEGDPARVNLQAYVEESLRHLVDENRNTQKKGIRILSALAQTKAGELALQPHVIDIVKMLHPRSDQPLLRSQLFGPSAVLYALCRNETLREQIHQSAEYAYFRDLFLNSTLLPRTRAT